MARQKPFTAQEERLRRLSRNAELKIVALKGMIDTAERIVAAQTLEVGDPDSPQVIAASESGEGLVLGGGITPWVRAITVGVSHTGDTLETEVGKITMPGDSIGPNGFVGIAASWLADGGGSNNRTLRIYFGGTKIAQVSSTSATVMIDTAPLYVWNKGATDSQEARSINVPHLHVRAGEGANTMAIDTTADVDITFTTQNANAGDSSRVRFALVQAIHQD